jgi:hypothetical protein
VGWFGKIAEAAVFEDQAGEGEIQNTTEKETQDTTEEETMQGRY